MCISPIVQSKSSPLPGLLNDILPSIVALATPQKGRRLDNKSRVCCPIPPTAPIISPHPADINRRLCHNFRHGSLVLSCFPSWLYTSAAEGSLAYPCPNGTMEVGGVSHAN